MKCFDKMKGVTSEEQLPADVVKSICLKVQNKLFNATALRKVDFCMRLSRLIRSQLVTKRTPFLVA